MKRSINLPKILLKRSYQWLGLIQGNCIGEELVSIDRNANTMGLGNWTKKEYR